MPAKSDPRLDAVATKYYYRRRARARELVPAISAGIAAGVVVFYLTRLMMQRTPLVADEQSLPPSTAGRGPKQSRRARDG